MKGIHRNKKIILIRHGKPSALMNEYRNKKIRVKDLQAFLNAYDDSDIDLSIKPNIKMHESLNELDTAFGSSLKRSLASFNYFNLQIPFIIDDIFNEFALPVYKKFPISMKPNQWLAFLRTMWFLKLVINRKRLKIVKQKAKEAALILIESTEKSNCIALFGHGVLNYFIKKELIKKGAKLKNKWEYGFWACNEFILYEIGY